MRVNARELSDALRFVKPARISSWPKGPRGKVLVEHNDQGLVLTTDWLECWFRITVRGEPGNTAAVVDHTEFNRLVPRRNEEIEITVDDGLTVHTDVGAHLPDLCESQDTKASRLADHLRADPPWTGDYVPMDFQAMADAAGAASYDVMRPILTTVHVTNESMAATDAYRIFIRYVATEALKQPILVPALAVRAAAKLTLPAMARVSDNWLVAFDSLHIVAAELTQPADQYPNWSKLLKATSGPHHVRFDNGIEKVLAKFPADECVVIQPGSEGKINLEARYQYLDEGGNQATRRQGMSAEVPGSSSVPLVGFNPRFLADMFCGANSRKLVGGGGSKPWKLQENAPGGKRVRLLMPVRVR